MSLDAGSLSAWITITIVFIVVIGLLYRKVTRARKQEPESKPEVDEHKDETPAY